MQKCFVSLIPPVFKHANQHPFSLKSRPPHIFQLKFRKFIRIYRIVFWVVLNNYGFFTFWHIFLVLFWVFCDFPHMPVWDQKFNNIWQQNLLYMYYLQSQSLWNFKNNLYNLIIILPKKSHSLSKDPQH